MHGHSKDLISNNPALYANGVASDSPGLPRQRLPWETDGDGLSTPTGLRPSDRRVGLNPVGVGVIGSQNPG